ncbi:hypothetical protein MML48_8g00010465 [Holotrichia oblita]|uniref:Uncharacterized protein n=1 Tax=Holotrichia oblita TaxID=644536 RepID=A0ACB9SNV5_HOLOL|nr:hypothetical protein MML48_8g00010465 [Holotrichia oblita]
MFTRNIIIKLDQFKYHLLKRFKHNASHWSVQKKKKTSCDRALDHFDEFYSQIFAKDWPSIRHGLLSKQKYIAVVNNFSDADQTKSNLEKIGALNIRTLFQLQKQYISDNYEKLRQKYNLKRIWKSGEETKVESIRNDIVQNAKQSHSLEHNLSQAEIDFTRVIAAQDVSYLNLTEFMPVTKLKGNEDWIAEPKHVDDYKGSDFSPKTSREFDFHFPENLNVYCYEVGNHNDFSPPINGTTGVLNYYLMDGGSLLPVLALDVKPGDKILDMCAAPGGKSYLILQTLYPDQLISNDVTKSRTNRVHNVMKQYLYDLEEKWLNQNKLRISLMDARDIHEGDFDKIIVDVPCTTDRHSVKETENNIFRPDRIKERLKLPELQTELLVQAIKLVKIGGNVVYSTCSLSPIQNDGVVHLALKQIWEETDIQITIKDLNVALLQADKIYKFADQKLMKYGHLIVPNLQINFGPTYFCKMQRIKPLLKNEDDASLKVILKSNLARIRKTRPNIPWEEIKHIPKQQRRAYRAKLSGLDPSETRNLTSKCIYLGINEVTKLIEKDEAIAVLLANDVEPHLMIKHVIDLCILKLVPILVVSDFKEFLKEVLGISAAAIAFGKDVDCDAKNETIVGAINQIFLNYPIPESHVSFNNGSLNFLNALHVSEEKVDAKQESDAKVYLYRDRKSSRVFIPRNSNVNYNEKQRMDRMEVDSSGFLSFNDDASEDYKSLIVKQVVNNPNRNKRKLEMLKNKKKKQKVK